MGLQQENLCSGAFHLTGLPLADGIPVWPVLLWWKG